ncbi:hypothetical protein ACET3Z_014039 [Daucus carota]
MGSWRSWLFFKNSLLHHSRAMPFKLTSFLKHKTKENKAGLMSLYKDMEACEGYADIQVMWKMIHSSSLAGDHNREMRNRRVCFRKA